MAHALLTSGSKRRGMSQLGIVSLGISQKVMAKGSRKGTVMGHNVVKKWREIGQEAKNGAKEPKYDGIRAIEDRLQGRVYSAKGKAGRIATGEHICQGRSEIGCGCLSERENMRYEPFSMSRMRKVGKFATVCAKEYEGFFEERGICDIDTLLLTGFYFLMVNGF